MFQIDKAKFGSFVASLRKEKGMTQKELAQKLYVSDKAVSKWETGASIPDVALLAPLAACLGVTVAELLEGRRIQTPLDTAQVEEVVQKAMAVPRQSWGKRLAILIVSTLASCLELGLAAGLGCPFHTALWLPPAMAFGFGLYFWLGSREQLPGYYDRERIGTYQHGPLRMNLPGVVFHNRNWPHLVRVLRVSSVIGMTVYPLLYLVGGKAFPAGWYGLGEKLLVAVMAVCFVGALYWTGKKYE